MSLAGWLRLLELTHCIDDDFTKREAVLAFVWSKMRTSDNFNDRNYQKVTHLQYTDFIEAICRVAEMKSMPTDEELEPFDGNTVAMYKAYTENNKPFERRPSSQWYNPKTRPLAEKLQKFISILCHELDMSVCSPVLAVPTSMVTPFPACFVTGWQRRWAAEQIRLCEVHQRG